MSSRARLKRWCSVLGAAPGWSKYSGVGGPEDVGEGGAIGFKAEVAEQYLLRGGVDDVAVAGRDRLNGRGPRR